MQVYLNQVYAHTQFHVVGIGIQLPVREICLGLTATQVNPQPGHPCVRADTEI